MKAKLTFNIDDNSDKIAFNRCHRSLDMAIALFRLSTHKDNEISGETYNIMKELDINLNDIIE